MVAIDLPDNEMQISTRYWKWFAGDLCFIWAIN